MKKVEVVPHDPRWRDAFEAEAKRVAAALGDNVVAVHHIGSTAIPGIHAKPVIDLLVEVGDVAEVDGRSAAMEALGYEVMGEYGIPGRRFFRKDDRDGARTHNIHAFQAGSAEVERPPGVPRLHDRPSGRCTTVRRAEADAGGGAPAQPRRLHGWQGRVHQGDGRQGGTMACVAAGSAGRRMKVGRMIVRSGDWIESTGYRSFGLQVFAPSSVTACPASG